MQAREYPSGCERKRFVIADIGWLASLVILAKHPAFRLRTHL
jgi:hypothetical protein